MTRIFFDIGSEDGELRERLTFSIYRNVSAQTRDFLFKFVREAGPGTFSYRGSAVYAFTSTFFAFGNLARRGITTKVHSSDPSYPFRTPKLGAGRRIARGGHLCLISANATSSSQELLVTLEDCANYEKDLVCVGELDGDTSALARIASYANVQMLRTKGVIYIINCGVEGDPSVPDSSLVDLVIQGERDRRAAEKEREDHWHREFSLKLGNPTVDMAKVHI
ncbi:Hypothetical protein GLP15_4977 [Giardia lamblia P15]|uniref:Uncharacterized protein n=1 Tax=Giardia intestinalis (strain P15) TaxID=658858 RepID=E1F7S0_GIAIA|nr:Hypothetical protein GLP15_4977 [Giardia lamblia P15]